MALEATHIRFAVDLMDKYDIKDISAYISGTLYPDSRNITKTERNLTHDEKYLEKEFASDDFKKGWQVHLLCDEIQGKYIRNATNTKDEIIRQNNDTWVIHTAVKVLQEISDLGQFDVSKYLQYSEILSAPNNEDKEVLNGYYEFVKNFYTKGDLQVEDYRAVFDVFGIPKNIENEVIFKCISLQKDEAKMREVEDLYSLMISEAREC